jgi:hypothetical protein
MKKSKSMKIIEQIALKHGVSAYEVRRDMQEAINRAFTHHDESVNDFWAKWGGRIPTPDEFIPLASREILEKVLK